MSILWCCIGDEVRDEFHYILVGADVLERVVAVRFIHVYKVENDDPVAHILQVLPYVPKKLSLRITKDEGRAAVISVWLDHIKGLAGAGSSNDQHIVVKTGLSGIRRYPEVF